MTTELLENQTTDGNGSTHDWPGGEAVLDAGGIWDGATVTFEVQHHPSIGWKALLDAVGQVAFSENSDGPIAVYLGKCKLRAVLSAAGPTTDVTAVIRSRFT